jgi:hypothetical protein
MKLQDDSVMMDLHVVMNTKMPFILRTKMMMLRIQRSQTA